MNKKPHRRCRVHFAVIPRGSFFTAGASTASIRRPPADAAAEVAENLNATGANTPTTPRPSPSRRMPPRGSRLLDEQTGTGSGSAGATTWAAAPAVSPVMEADTRAGFPTVSKAPAGNEAASDVDTTQQARGSGAPPLASSRRCAAGGRVVSLFSRPISHDACGVGMRLFTLRSRRSGRNEAWICFRAFAGRRP